MSMFSRLKPNVLAWLPVEIRARRGQVVHSFLVEYGIGHRDVRRELRTDFASTPRPLWWVFPPTGWWLAHAILHDQDYQDGAHSRLLCDLRFLVGLVWAWRHTAGLYGILPLDDEADPATWPQWKLRLNHLCNAPIPWLFFLGVRLGGWIAWRKHRQRDASRNVNSAGN